MSDDYEVGYRKPPEKGKFKKRESGNPKGRPKAARSGPADVFKVLDEPVTVRQEGVTREIHPFEAGVRRLVSLALKDENLDAALEFIKICEKYEIMMPESLPRAGGVMRVPKNWDWNEWMEMFNTHGPPPWPGGRSGLCESRPPDSTEGEPK